MPTTSGIYLLTVEKTGDTYVGQAQRLRSRCRGHVRNVCKRFRQNRHWNRVLDANCGASDLAFSILEECPLDKLGRREHYWIKKLKPTLNIHSGNMKTRLYPARTG